MAWGIHLRVSFFNALGYLWDLLGLLEGGREDCPIHMTCGYKDRGDHVTHEPRHSARSYMTTSEIRA
eukprot:4125613-Amphidinium_carterae.1